LSEQDFASRIEERRHRQKALMNFFEAAGYNSITGENNAKIAWPRSRDLPRRFPTLD